MKLTFASWQRSNWCVMTRVYAGPNVTQEPVFPKFFETVALPQLTVSFSETLTGSTDGADR
jgi:hypothetical protein